MPRHLQSRWLLPLRSGHWCTTQSAQLATQQQHSSRQPQLGTDQCTSVLPVATSRNGIGGDRAAGLVTRATNYQHTSSWTDTNYRCKCLLRSGTTRRQLSATFKGLRSRPRNVCVLAAAATPPPPPTPLTFSLALRSAAASSTISICAASDRSLPYSSAQAAAAAVHTQPQAANSTWALAAVPTLLLSACMACWCSALAANLLTCGSCQTSIHMHSNMHRPAVEQLKAHADHILWPVAHV